MSVLLASVSHGHEFLLDLPVQGPPSLLVLVRLSHKAPHGLQGRLVLLLVIACLVQPGEHLVPLVDGAVEVLHGPFQPVGHVAFAPVPTLTLLAGQGIMPQGGHFPGERVESRTGRDQGRSRDRLFAKVGPLPYGCI